MVEEKLKELGLNLPEPATPVASYIPCIKTGSLIFVSGQLPFKEGKLLYKGKVGKDITVEEGKLAAELCVLNALAVVKKEIGTLDKIKKIIRVSGFVNCTEDFESQPQVINGASDLLVNLFGDKGKHTRIAIGVNSLPLGSSVEIDFIFEI